MIWNGRIKMAWQSIKRTRNKMYTNSPRVTPRTEQLAQNGCLFIPIYQGRPSNSTAPSRVQHTSEKGDNRVMDWPSTSVIPSQKLSAFCFDATLHSQLTVWFGLLPRPTCFSFLYAVAYPGRLQSAPVHIEYSTHQPVQLESLTGDRTEVWTRNLVLTIVGQGEGDDSSMLPGHIYCYTYKGYQSTPLIVTTLT